MRSRYFIALFLSFSLLAGCGGTSSLMPGGAPPGAGGGAGASNPNWGRVGKNGTLRLHFKIPKKHRAVRRGRMHGHYLSAATQSVNITIKQGNTTVVDQDTDLTPSSQGCSSSLADTLCQVSFILKPCSTKTNCYTAALTTYDATGGAGGAGNVLSAAQNVAFTVSPGVAQTISLTLSGLPKSIQVQPVGVGSVSAFGGVIDMFGIGSAHKLLIQALDADGNVIFGQGAPTFTVGQSGPVVATLTQPTTANPNLLVVTLPSAFASGQTTLTITASYAGQATDGCTLTGAACSGSQVIEMRELLAVVNNTGPTLSNGSVTIYEAGNQTPYAIVSAGVYKPHAVTFDSSGNLYVANCYVGCNVGTSSDNVTIYAPPYTAAPTTITTGITDPQSLLVSPSGELFVGNCATCATVAGAFDTITRYKPPFSSSSRPAVTITSNVVDPVSLAMDTGGNLWAADCGTCGPGGGNFVTSYTAPSFTTTYKAAVVGTNEPVSIALDPSNNLFVADEFSGVRIFYPPAYNFSGLNPSNIISSIGGNGLAQSISVISDASGNFWVADRTNNKLLRCSQPFTGNTCSASLVVSSGIATPTWVAMDGESNIYSVNATGGSGGSGTITQYGSASYTTLSATMTNSSNTPFGMAVLP